MISSKLNEKLKFEYQVADFLIKFLNYFAYFVCDADKNTFHILGLPAYTTAAGWLGYSEEKIVNLSEKFMSEGFSAFKLKVGSDLEDDIRRCRIM